MDENTIIQKRIMPNNKEMEQAVIGSMLMDVDAIPVAMEKLSDEDKQVIKKNADIAKNIKNILVDLKIKFEEIYLKFFNKDIEKI